MWNAIRNWFNKDLVQQLAAARLAHFNALQEVKDLSTQNTELRTAKNYVGAVHKDVYEQKVLYKIGNAYLSGTEDSSFKLGIQFALRHVEKELVAG